MKTEISSKTILLQDSDGQKKRTNQPLIVGLIHYGSNYYFKFAYYP